MTALRDKIIAWLCIELTQSGRWSAETWKIQVGSGSEVGRIQGEDVSSRERVDENMGEGRHVYPHRKWHFSCFLKITNITRSRGMSALGPEIRSEPAVKVLTGGLIPLHPRSTCFLPSWFPYSADPGRSEEQYGLVPVRLLVVFVPMVTQTLGYFCHCCACVARGVEV